MDLSAVATALSGLADNVTGVNGYDYMPGHPVPPCAVVTLLGVSNYRDIQHELEEITAQFRISVYAQTGDPRDGQHRLLGYVSSDGSLSIPAAITASPTLGISGVSATVTSSGGLEQIVTDSGEVYYGVAIDVEVIG